MLVNEVIKDEIILTDEFTPSENLAMRVSAYKIARLHIVVHVPKLLCPMTRAARHPGGLSKLSLQILHIDRIHTSDARRIVIRDCDDIPLAEVSPVSASPTWRDLPVSAFRRSRTQTT